MRVEEEAKEEEVAAEAVDRFAKRVTAIYRRNSSRLLDDLTFFSLLILCLYLNEQLMCLQLYF